MTVIELISELQSLVRDGYGDDEIFVWDKSKEYFDEILACTTNPEGLVLLIDSETE